jgi:anthranilate synthase/aminodeoxychorismate synthase-like glutamine amidotransferase
LIIIIDNYDSFTYNLLDIVERLGYECKVVRNDEIHLDELISLKPKGIIISPGPGVPKDAGFLMDFIKYFNEKLPILGVCLGQQAIAEYFGAKIKHAIKPMHGKTSIIQHNNHPMYKDIENPCTMMRYHSLVVNDLPECLEVTAESNEHEIMSIAHKSLPIWAVQYHPESILSRSGEKIISNWLAYFSIT